MPALTILIIRHAEKAGEAWPGPGLMPDGTDDKKSLVIRGWQRAGSWATLFGASLGGSNYPNPSLIYAADPKIGISEEPSNRPFETVIPLAERLGLTPITDFAVGAEAELATEIVAKTGVILVSWEHKAITGTLVPAILNGQAVEGVPKKWAEARYDVVLRLDRNTPESRWSFAQLFPCLLSGDSITPM